MSPAKEFLGTLVGYIFIGVLGMFYWAFCLFATVIGAIMGLGNLVILGYKRKGLSGVLFMAILIAALAATFFSGFPKKNLFWMVPAAGVISFVVVGARVRKVNETLGARKAAERKKRVPPYKSPPWPKLISAEEGDPWEGEGKLPAWSGFTSEDGPSTGEFALTVDPPGEDEEGPAPPAPEQGAAFIYLKKHDAEVLEAVLAAVFKEYPAMKTELQEFLPSAAEKLPEIRKPEDLKQVMDFASVYVSTIAKDGSAYIGFEFGSPLEEEHGIGVMTHKSRVVRVGQAMDASDEYLGIEDGGADLRNVPGKGKKPKWVDLIVTGDIEGFRAWLDTGGDPMAWDDKRQETPLHFAVDEEKTELIMLLLERGVDPSEVLRSAVSNRNWELAMAALSRLKDRKAPDIDSPFQTALGHCRDPRVIEAFLDAGADIRGKLQRGNALYHATEGPCEPAVIRLLLDRGAQVGKFGYGGDSALTKAILKGDVEVCKMLIDAGEQLYAEPPNPDGDLFSRALILISKTFRDLAKSRRQKPAAWFFDNHEKGKAIRDEVIAYAAAKGQRPPKNS